MDQENQERLEEVLKDKAFVKQMLATERPEDVQASLEEKGVELTVDEIKQIGELIAKVQKGGVTQEQLKRAANGELSEDELEGVAGGFIGIGALIATYVIAAFVGAGAITTSVLFGGW